MMAMRSKPGDKKYLFRFEAAALAYILLNFLPPGYGFANICTRLIKVSVVFSNPRRELNSNLP